MPKRTPRRSRLAAAGLAGAILAATVSASAFAAPARPQGAGAPDFALSASRSGALAASPKITARAASAPHASRPAAAGRQLSADAAARATARSTGRPVTVAAATTETSSTVANPDGSFTMHTSVLPVRVKAGRRWRPVDATLRRTGTGSLRPAATPSGLVLSGGGRGPLAVLTSPAGGRLSVTLPVKLPAPAVSGASATYRSVLPGVDLRLVATSVGGIDDDLIVHGAAAASPRLRRLRLALAPLGLRMSAAAGGGLRAESQGGRLEFTESGPLSGESAPPAVLPGQHAIGPAAQPASRAGAYPADIASAITPDAFTASGFTVNSANNGYTQANQQCPNETDWNGSQPNGYGLGVGYQHYSADCGSAAGNYRAYFQINTTNLDPSMKVQSATFSADENYGADFGCSDKWPLTLHLTDAISQGTDWANKPANGPNDQPSTLQVHPGLNPNSSCTRQAVSYDVTYAMVLAAAHSFSDTTFGFSGDETASSTNYGFMRIGVNPSINTTFDLVPPVPATSSLASGPPPQDIPSGAADYGCNTSGKYGWISQTSADLTAEIKAYISQEYVRAIYHMTDSKNSGASVSPVPGPSNWYPNADGTTHTSISFALKDGHQYGWTAEANVDGSNPFSGGGTDGSNTTGYTSAQSAQCHFNVDLSAPSQPTVTSTSFPPSGSGQTGLTAGQPGTFTFTSADPVPGGCTPAPCLASGVAWFEYSLNTPIPASGAAHVAASANSNGSAATGTLNLTVGNWGTNTLYVAAVDNAGNVTQTHQYTFYAPWNPSAKVTAGDVNGDGIPDLLGTTSSNLVMYPGNLDPAVTPVTAGPQAASPDGTAWNTFQVTHRGSLSSQGVDDLLAHKGGDLYIYPNNPASQGTAPQFDNALNAVAILSHPACSATADNANNCAGYATGSWSDVTQILSAGDAWTGSSSDNGLPSLLTVENGQLWLYQSQFGNDLAGPIQLGSSAGTTNWAGMTLIAPGTVAGQLTIWARNNATGAIYSYPVTIDANGLPTLNPATPGTPVSATSGPVITGLTLPASTYPAVASPGALDNSSFPGLYAEVTSGTTPAGGSCATGCLWYYPGQSTTGGAQPITGTPVFVGVLAAPVTQLS